ncbi:glycosyltransferase family 4 protein [Thermogemmatispora onikobensis]|uniref:glycosyltransferase family 4 protein n=1 Tax=Thermogemmatispora onikobensis TaxID=732234 RepID=UPI000852E39E|nr:glycosyltransferase [Thermogemmatispora onikobensis]
MSISYEYEKVRSGSEHQEGGWPQQPGPYPTAVLKHCLSQSNPLVTSTAALQTACRALTHWNRSLVGGDHRERDLFLEDARRLLALEQPLGNGAGGWPLVLLRPGGGPTLCLSAPVQSCVLAVLLRALSMTGDQAYMLALERCLKTFHCDILDGGIYSPLYADGIFFEELAIYPATHSFTGMALALLSLHELIEYWPACEEVSRELYQRALTTFERSLCEFAGRFWPYRDLATRCLVTAQELALQIALLDALAASTKSEVCVRARQHWQHYSESWLRRLRSRWWHARHSLSARLWRFWQPRLFPRPASTPSQLRVCVPLPAFPAIGGVLTVLEGIEEATQGHWRMEYLTRAITDQETGKYVIHRFGRSWMGASHFPFVWFYVLTGAARLFALLRQGTAFDLVLPQDAVFSALLSAPLGHLAGARVVCIDHGHLTLLQEDIHPLHLAERRRLLAHRSRLRRLIGRLQEWCYWPSYRLMLRLAARRVDQYLVPGVPGDGVETMAARFGIPASRVVRFASMVNIERYPVPSEEERAGRRQEYGFRPDDMVVAIACRLTPEKGLDLALASLARALERLKPTARARVRLIIAGDGPLRQELERTIDRLQLHDHCALWGELSAPEIARLLSISDIFLYTSTRGACFSMAVLEAMAAGCAVIASTRPPSNALLLAEGRGIAVRPADTEETANALVRLLDNPALCRQMGRAARAYIATQHSPETFRRALLRASGWAALEQLLTETVARNGLEGEVED